MDTSPPIASKAIGKSVALKRKPSISDSEDDVIAKPKKAPAKSKVSLFSIRYFRIQ